jgi:bla regulator protein blaR1
VYSSYPVALANHLWQSTVFLGIVACLISFLKKNKARVRYCLWLAASAKFMVPFALLTVAGAQIPWPVRSADGSDVLSTAGRVVARITNFGGTGATPLIVQTVNPGDVVLVALGVIWLAGTLALAARSLLLWRRVHQTLRESSQISLPFVIPAKSSSSQLVPAVVGFFRPTLLLPQGIEERLAPEEMRAVLAHEECHVLWHDNLAAAFHMVVEAVFWFNPFIWWLSSRLINERERACDERVLAEGHAPKTYAEGILKVCEHYLQFRFACVAGVSGTNLRQRIEAIMKNELVEPLSRARKLVLTAMATSAIVVPVIVGSLASTHALAQAAVSDPAAHVFIHLSSPDEKNVPAPKIPLKPGRWIIDVKLPLRSLIARAYGVSESQVVGRDWSRERIYQITADGPPSGMNRGDHALLQDLLARHFGLVVKIESGSVEGYVLRNSVGNTKLKSGGDDSGKLIHFYPHGVDMTNCPMSALARFLERGLNAPVVDKTGLNGNYDYKFTWKSSAPDAPDSATAATALETQLGLSLQAESVTADVIHVLSMKSPNEVVTANVTAAIAVSRASP